MSVWAIWEEGATRAACILHYAVFDFKKTKQNMEEALLELDSYEFHPHTTFVGVEEEEKKCVKDKCES